MSGISLNDALKLINSESKSYKATDNSTNPDFETEASGWDDAIMMFVGENLDISRGRVDYDYDKLALKFQDSADEDDALYNTYQVLHKIDRNVEMRPHAHIIDPDGTNIIGWKMKYRLWKNDATVGAWSAEQDATYIFTKATDKLNIVTFPNIDISSLSESDMVDVKFYRNDAVSGDAWLKQADFHFKTKKITGSVAEWGD